MTGLEATVALGVVLIPTITSAVSMGLVRRSAVAEAKKIRDEAADAAKALKTEAEAATLTAREAAVAAKEATETAKQTSKNVDGTISKLIDEIRKQVEQAGNAGFLTGLGVGQERALEGPVLAEVKQVKEVLKNQDVKSEARHEEMLNGALNGTLNGTLNGSKKLKKKVP